MRNAPSSFPGVLVLAALLLSTGLLQSAERNIIFFITDDESPTLGCCGDKASRTPHIDALAADATLFENALATAASYSASRESELLFGIRGLHFRPLVHLLERPVLFGLALDLGSHSEATEVGKVFEVNQSSCGSE